MQVFVQQRSLAARWNLMTPGAYTQLELFDACVVQYTTADGSTPPAPDTLLGSTAATTLAGDATFDNSDLWAVCTIAGSGRLSLVLRALVEGLDALLPPGTKWALLGIVRAGWVESLDLAAGGVVVAAADGAALEGDLLYYHLGAWHLRHVGPAGWVLASDGVDPVYANLTALTFPPGSEGDLWYFHSGVWQRFPIGHEGDVLVTHNGDPYWSSGVFNDGGSGTPPPPPINFGSSDPATMLTPHGTCRALNLGVGGSPPAGWDGTSFNDSGWPDTVVSGPNNQSPAVTVWSANPLPGRGQVSIFRQVLPVPAGITLGAAALVRQGGSAMHFSLNGHTLFTSSGANLTLPYSVDPALVLVGQDNVIAWQVLDDSPNPAAIPYMFWQLTLTLTAGQGPVRTPPGAGRGDLLYFDGTAWQLLKAGANGTVLTMAGGVPTWT